MTQFLVSGSISTDNLFTAPTNLQSYFNLSISGTWQGTLTVQRSFDFGSTWYDVKNWTANTQEYGFEPEGGVWYKAGIKTGNYTSGICVVRLSQ